MGFSPTDVPAEDLVMDDPNMERETSVLDSTGARQGSVAGSGWSPAQGRVVQLAFRKHL